MKLSGGENAARYTIVNREGERRAREKGDETIFRRSSLALCPAKPTVLRVTRVREDQKCISSELLSNNGNPLESKAYRLWCT